MQPSTALDHCASVMTTTIQPDEPVESADATSPVASKRRRVARNVVLGVLGTIFAAWAILFVTKGRFLTSPFERIVGRMTHREVRVGGDFQLYFAPLKIKFYAERLRVSNPDWATKPNLFEAERIDTRIAPLSLLFGRRRLYWLDLTNGALDMEWNAAHDRNTWTFSEKKGGKPFDLPRIDRATIAGTSVRYRDPRMRLLADLDVDTIRSVEARIGQAVGVKGAGTIRSTPFSVTARLLSPDATANRGENKLVATARAAGNIVDVSGTLPSLADIEDVPLRVEARGRDLSTLLGIIDVVIPQTRTYRLRGTMVKTGDEYRFTRLSGVAGATDLAGRLTITNGARLHLDSQLATRSLDIVDAAPFIGFNPDTVATKGVTAAAAETGAAPARLMPDAAFPVETMRRFDADLKWTIQTVRSRRVPISNVDVTLNLTRGKLTVSPLTFAMARGNVASDLLFDTRQRPSAVSYDIRLAPTPLARLLAGWGVSEAGTSGTIRGRIQLAGRGDTIHDSLSTARGRIAFVLPGGTLWTRNAELAELDIGTFVQKMFSGALKEPVNINCGLIGFTVRGGVAAADPVLIDTRKNVVTARGGFSFRTEGVDLAFKADSKKFSLFSGQSPVGIRGTFAQPGLQVITPELLSRAGVGLGLAVLATPVAGLIAFVDPGDAKAAACGPILAGKTAAAQRTADGEARSDVGEGRDQPKKRKKFLGIF